MKRGGSRRAYHAVLHRAGGVLLESVFGLRAATNVSEPGMNAHFSVTKWTLASSMPKRIAA